MNCNGTSNLSNVRRARASEAGFSLLQMLVALAIIGIVLSFGIIAIKRSQRDLELQSSIRQLSGYLEKGRVEAVRRHVAAATTIVNIPNNSSYTVTLDSNYDGTIAASETRTVTLPTGVTFNSANITYPATIAFDSRGRSSSTGITGSTISMSNTNGTTTNLTMTGGGDLTLDSTVTGPAASTSLAPVTTVSNTANVKAMN